MIEIVCVYFYVFFYFCVFYFSLFLCLGCFSFYVFRVQVLLFLYSVFTRLRVLGCFHSIACFRLVLGIVCERISRSLMEGQFESKKFKKIEKRMKRDPWIVPRYGIVCLKCWGDLV